MGEIGLYDEDDYEILKVLSTVTNENSKEFRYRIKALQKMIINVDLELREIHYSSMEEY